MDCDQVVVGIADLSSACLTGQDLPVTRVEGIGDLGSGEEQVRQLGARHRCLQVGRVMADDEQAAAGCDGGGQPAERRLAGGFR